MGKLIGRFAGCASGSSSVQSAMLFGAVAMALAVLGAPFLQGAAQYYAQNRALGIDRVMTGSVEKGSYTVRRSVLSETPVTICDSRNAAACKEK